MTRQVVIGNIVNIAQYLFYYKLGCGISNALNVVFHHGVVTGFRNNCDWYGRFLAKGVFGED